MVPARTTIIENDKANVLWDIYYFCILFIFSFIVIVHEHEHNLNQKVQTLQKITSTLITNYKENYTTLHYKDYITNST